MSKAVFVGVDVSMDKLDVSITLDGLKYDSLQVFNNEGSILGFFDYLKSTYKKSEFFFGYEATSNYMHTLQKLCHSYNFKNIMINPYMMSHYLKHLNSRKKDDITDSKGIAKYILTLENDDFKTVFNQNEKTLRKYSSSINLLRKLDTQLTNFIHLTIVTVVSIFVSMRERVKGLEADVVELKKEQNEARSKHETIAKMDDKLDLLLDRFIPKQG